MYHLTHQSLGAVVSRNIRAEEIASFVEIPRPFLVKFVWDQGPGILVGKSSRDSLNVGSYSKLRMPQKHINHLPGN